MKLKVTTLLFIAITIFFCGCKKGQNDALVTSTSTVTTQPGIDYRQAELGTTIFANKYVDQPYILQLSNGSWLCAFTTSPTQEGGTGETIGVSISSDKGKSWSFLNYLEPVTGPPAFYGIPFVTSYGRVYIIYGYNQDDVLFLNGARIRVDAVGKMVYRYSDDNGATWSARQIINIPTTQYDLLNNWMGQYQEWWTICKPILSVDNQLYFSFTKIEKYLYNIGEGWVVNSPNINTEQDTSKLIWNFLPSGQIGIRSATMGNVQEEHNIVQMNNGYYACVFRTAEGYPAICYSADTCKTWSAPEPVTMSDGYKARNPRACARIFKFTNGKYLLWFENNNVVKTNDRNPAWILGGTESNGQITWSQPEVLLYSNDTTQNFSYPDIIQNGSGYYLSETQKTIARISPISTTLLNNIWQQGTIKVHSTANLVTDVPGTTLAKATSQNYAFSSMSLSNGVSINMSVNISSFPATSQTIFALLSADKTDTLIKVKNSSSNTVEVDLYGANAVIASYYCDNNLIKLNAPTFISISLDADSRVLSAMVNGVLCNGYGPRNYGWILVPASFTFSATTSGLYLSSFNGSVSKLQIYSRGLTTSEMLSEYLAI